MAEADERVAAARAIQAERDAMPAVDREQLTGALIVRDRRDGRWFRVVRVNKTTVTVMAWGIESRIPHHRIIGARPHGELR